jgi:hypothetical protein
VRDNPRCSDSKRDRSSRPRTPSSSTKRQAFELLRSHSRRTGRKLINVAEAATTSHLLLAAQPAPATTKSQPSGVRAEPVPSALLLLDDTSSPARYRNGSSPLSRFLSQTGPNGAP